MRFYCCALLTLLAGSVLAGSAVQESAWKKDLGKAASELVPSGWAGTPVSLEAVKGNAVALVFWTADVPC